MTNFVAKCHKKDILKNKKMKTCKNRIRKAIEHEKWKTKISLKKDIDLFKKNTIILIIKNYPFTFKFYTFIIKN